MEFLEDAGRPVEREAAWIKSYYTELFKQFEYICQKETEALQFVKSDWSESEIKEAISQSNIKAVLLQHGIKQLDAILGISDQERENQILK